MVKIKAYLNNKVYSISTTQDTLTSNPESAAEEYLIDLMNDLLAINRYSSRVVPVNKK